MNLTSPSDIKRLLNDNGFSFSKSLGQNFLIDRNIVNKIVSSAEIIKTDVVVEIGPGIGVLTSELCKHSEQTVAIEIDKRLIGILETTLSEYNNLTIINKDFLKVNSLELNKVLQGKQFKIVANLPYYITTPIIFRIIENNFNYSSIVIMIQKEVGDRIMASPGTKEYGAMTVALQYYTTPSLVCRVPKTVFMPSPAVDSIVVKLTKKKVPPVELVDRDFFFKTVKAAFSQRRKTISNTLKTLGKEYSKEKIIYALKKTNIDNQRRGETLTIEEFAHLSNQLALL